MIIKRLALLAVFITYILIVYGGYVASSESGMGCGPDWPLCNGVFIPSLHGDTLVEYTHRVIGAILGIITIILWVSILKTKPNPRVRLIANMMLGLLIVQVLLGAMIVFLDLPAVVITIHLLISLIFMAHLIYFWRSPPLMNLHMSNYRFDNIFVQRHILTHINTILVFLLITITLGAYIKHQQYGLACNWLGCRESFLPSDSSQLLQTLHRLFAVITSLYLILYAYWTFTKSRNPHLRKCVILAVVLVIAQIVIGVFTIVTNIELSWAVIHLATATALFGVMTEARVSL